MEKLDGYLLAGVLVLRRPRAFTIGQNVFLHVPSNELIVLLKFSPYDNSVSKNQSIVSREILALGIFDVK